MIICEVGLNHMGDEHYAWEILEELSTLDIYGISFQIREKEFNKKNPQFLLSSSFYSKAQKMLASKDKKLGYAICEKTYAGYVGNVNADFHKVLSWAIGNDQLIKDLSKISSNMIYLSTGMSDFSHLEEILKRYKSFPNIALIHTQLSFDLKEVNLACIPELKIRYKLPVAYGHHCENLDILSLSLPFRPNALFIYVKGDRHCQHPDEKHAFSLNQLSKTLEHLKIAKTAIGNPLKSKIKNQISSFG